MQANKGVDTSRILEKGPGYFRKQMDREREAQGRERPSAVERLAASKPKYVKSPAVPRKSQRVAADTRSQEPAATRSPSASSNGSSARSSSVEPRGRASQEAEPPRDPSRTARRISSKNKRPDSLLIYRHRHENAKDAADRSNLVRRHLLDPLKEKVVPPPAGAEQRRGPKRSDNTCVGCEDGKEAPAPRTEPSPLGSEPESRARRGVTRSHSDISSRYSRNFSEFDTFFTYCGLDSDVVEALGKESFSARSDDLEQRVRSVSASTSDDGFARRSDCSDGLLEEELGDNVRQNTSVIERNARIIKWLYSCKNASETGKILRDLE